MQVVLLAGFPGKSLVYLCLYLIMRGGYLHPATEPQNTTQHRGHM